MSLHIGASIYESPYRSLYRAAPIEESLIGASIYRSLYIGSVYIGASKEFLEYPR